MDRISTKAERLKELIDPTKYTEKDYKIIYEIVMSIFHDVDYEVPNSATFSMALDSLEQGEKIYSIKEKKKKTLEVEETSPVG